MKDFPECCPLLARYSGITAKPLHICQARVIFRAEQHVRYYPNPFEQFKDAQLMDDGSLSVDQFEFLMSIRSADIPIRIGLKMGIEPYYPNRFTRQFGFDQGVLANDLHSAVVQKSLCGIERSAIAQEIGRASCRERVFRAV